MNKYKALIFTIVGVVGIGVTVWGIQRGYKLFLKAELAYRPNNVQISNITEGSATITWTTEVPASSFVAYGETGGLGRVERNDKQEKTGFITLENLKPTTTYYFKIGIGGQTYGQNDEAYRFTTFTIPEIPFMPDEIYGKVETTDGKSVAYAPLFIRIKDANWRESSGQSALLSVLTGKEGTFSQDLGNARVADGHAYFQYSADDVVEITVGGLETGTVQISSTFGQAHSFSKIVLDPTTKKGEMISKTDGSTPLPPVSILNRLIDWIRKQLSRLR